MAELPDELRRLIEKEDPPTQEQEKGVDELLIQEVAHLLYPLNARESPRTTDERNLFTQRYRRQLSRGAFVGGDDVLLDQLRGLRQQQEEASRRIKVLVAYARTTPPGGRKYRLRELADATGIPISSIRGLITDAELREIERLDLDEARAERLSGKFLEGGKG